MRLDDVPPRQRPLRLHPAGRRTSRPAALVAAIHRHNGRAGLLVGRDRERRRVRRIRSTGSSTRSTPPASRTAVGVRSTAHRSGRARHHGFQTQFVTHRRQRHRVHRFGRQLRVRVGCGRQHQLLGHTQDVHAVVRGSHVEQPSARHRRRERRALHRIRARHDRSVRCERQHELLGRTEGSARRCGRAPRPGSSVRRTRCRRLPTGSCTSGRATATCTRSTPTARPAAGAHRRSARPSGWRRPPGCRGCVLAVRRRTASCTSAPTEATAGAYDAAGNTNCTAGTRASAARCGGADPLRRELVARGGERARLRRRRATARCMRSTRPARWAVRVPGGVSAEVGVTSRVDDLPVVARGRRRRRLHRLVPRPPRVRREDGCTDLALHDGGLHPGSPAVANGKVYIGSGDGKLYTLG